MSDRTTPFDGGPDAGGVVVDAGAADAGDETVALDGGHTPLACVVRIDTVNGAPWTDGATIAPLDDVVVTVGGSAGLVDAGAERVEWEISERPSASRALLTAPTSVSTAFHHAGGGAGIDAAGRYQLHVSLVVGGVLAANECVVAFDAVPRTALHVALAVDSPVAVALHVVRADAADTFCVVDVPRGPEDVAVECDAGLDCVAGACGPDGGPDWDGVGPHPTDGDPVATSSVDAFAPRHVDVVDLAAGRYLVGVEGRGGATHATLRLYVAGSLRAEQSFHVSAADWVEAAVVDARDGGVACIHVVVDGGASGGCP